MHVKSNSSTLKEEVQKLKVAAFHMPVSIVVTINKAVAMWLPPVLS